MECRFPKDEPSRSGQHRAQQREQHVDVCLRPDHERSGVTPQVREQRRTCAPSPRSREIDDLDAFRNDGSERALRVEDDQSDR
jgi:hypothetical protein